MHNSPYTVCVKADLDLKMQGLTADSSVQNVVMAVLVAIGGCKCWTVVLQSYSGVACIAVGI